MSLQQLGTVGLNKFLRFPSGFSLGVIVPLHLIEITGLISSDSSLVVHNFDRMLWIDKIGFQLHILHFNNLGRNTEAFSELRDMEYVMHRG